MSGRAVRATAVGVTVLVAVSLFGIAETGAQQSPPVNQPGVTNSEIRVGGVATVSNDPTGATLGTAFDGTNAYFDYINSTEKGVCGRKLVLSSKHDDALASPSCRWRITDTGSPGASTVTAAAGHG